MNCSIVFLTINLVSVAFAQDTRTFESPPILQAPELAPATLLNGSGFHVDKSVPTDGLTANYAIRTDLGPLQAHGLEMLRIRVAEMPTMVELQNTSKTRVFVRSVFTAASRQLMRMKVEGT